MTKEAVDRWLDAYVRAWKSYDRDEIAALFSADVVYRYHPYDEPIEGREAVVDSWLGEGDEDDASTRDPEGTYEADVPGGGGRRRRRGAPSAPAATRRCPPAR